MNVVIPQPIRLLSCNVAENDAQEWRFGITYAKGIKVLYNHHIFESLVDANVGTAPGEQSSQEGLTAVWRDLGASNRWKMFDDIVGSQTEVTGTGELSIVMKLDFKLASGFALLNLNGTRMVAEVFEGDAPEPYWRNEYNLVKPVGSWWDWYFLPIEYTRDVVSIGIPASGKGRIQVTLYGTNRVAVGNYVHGMVKTIGATQYEPSVGVRSWSKKIDDGFGNIKFIRGRNAKRNNLDLFVSTSEADTVYETLRTLVDEPALWMGDNRDSAEGGLQMLTVYGWCEEFNEVVRGPNYTQISLSIQGLV